MCYSTFKLPCPLGDFSILPLCIQKLSAQRNMERRWKDSCDVKSYCASIILEKRRIERRGKTAALKELKSCQMGGELFTLWVPKGRPRVEWHKLKGGTVGFKQSKPPSLQSLQRGIVLSENADTRTLIAIL